MVESFIVILRQLSYAIKNQLVASKALLGALEGKITHRWLWMAELVLYGIRELV